MNIEDRRMLNLESVDVRVTAYRDLQFAAIEVSPSVYFLYPIYVIIA